MSENDLPDPVSSCIIIPFPKPFRVPKIFEKTSVRQTHEASPKAAKTRAKRRRYIQKLLVDFPAVMASAFVDLRPASIPVWRADLEAADDEEFLLAEVFLSQFHQIQAFTNTSSYTIKGLCEDWHGYLGLDGCYVSNGVLIAAAISLSFRCKCIPGTPNAIFNISKKDLNYIRRLIAEHRASRLAADLRGTYP